VKRRVIFSPEAEADLVELYDYIANEAGPDRAIGYIERIEKSCLSLERVSERGTKRDDLRPGLRIMGFERRVTIAFHVEPATVIVDRILYGGRDLGRALRKPR
jgi:toxin ParE1/3/4